MNERTLYRKKPKRVGPPPPYTSALVHLMKNRIPYCIFDICAKILIKAMPGAAIASPYLEGFSDLKVEVQFPFVL